MSKLQWTFFGQLLSVFVQTLTYRIKYIINTANIVFNHRLERLIKQLTTIDN